MNNTKTNIIGAIAVIALLGVLWLGLTHSSQTSSGQVAFAGLSNTNASAAGTVLANNQLLPNPTLWDYGVFRQYLYIDKAIGYGNSTATPILQQGARAAIVASNGIVCSLQNPYTATSTYEFSVNISSSSASAGNLLLASATNTVATTSAGGFLATNQGVIAIGANATLTWGTSGTTTTGSSFGSVGPSGYLNLGGLTGSTATLAQLGGNCNAIFTSTN